MLGNVSVSRRGLWLVLLMLAGCLPRVGSSTGETPPVKYRAFFRLPLSQQVRAIKDYPIEEQIDIYLYAVQKQHPPVLGFAYDIAERGPTAVPTLLQRLREAPSDLTKADLIYVFEAMAVRGSYDVKGDSGVMRAIEAAISTMRWEATRNRSRTSLQVILRSDTTRR